MASLKEHWLSGVNQTEKDFIGRWRKSTSAGKSKVAASVAFVAALCIIALYAKNSDLDKAKTNRMLDDVSGVWRIVSDPSTVVKINLLNSSKQVRLIGESINQTLVSFSNCQTGQMDITNNIVPLSCNVGDQNLSVSLTIRQIFKDSDHKNFTLVMSTIGMPESRLSFVRNLDQSGN